MISNPLTLKLLFLGGLGKIANLNPMLIWSVTVYNVFISEKQFNLKQEKTAITFKNVHPIQWVFC